MKIVGFAHVLMINEYLEIVKEQFDMMHKSKLFDSVDKIHVGCLGPRVNVDKLAGAIGTNKIAFYNASNTNLYEFFTLRILKNEVDKDNFYGFYIHTKGVTWPGHMGGKYWRDYMNYYNITRWRDCYERLRRGYDTCGIKYLDAKHSPNSKNHYSGNYFWFKSVYAKRLKGIDSMNLKDRFEAECYICSAGARAACLCNTFVDYNTKGIFKP